MSANPNPNTPAARGKEKFLSVPTNHRPRQNSVDSEDGARSVGSSYGDTMVGSSHGDAMTMTTSWQGEKSLPKHTYDNEDIMKDEAALTPDAGREPDFQIENNPFAFSPGQLTKMFNPKSLSAFYSLGGLAGLEKGLRSNRNAGLGVDEKHLDGTVSFEQATARSQSSKLVDEGVESPETPVTHTGTAQPAEPDQDFADRKRVFKDNRLPEKKGKSFLQLVWITYNDKVLILLSVAAVVSLAIGLYQTFGAAQTQAGQGVEWIEGVAIIVAIVIVVLVGSLNDWQKERQFAKLNKKKQDRLVKAVRSGKTVEISVFDVLSGDVLHLEPGDLIPVDGVLIQGFNVKCDESQATGESDIIRKRPADEVFAGIESGENTTKLDPFIQSGGRVMEGVGTFMVTSTGVYSSYGKTMMSLSEDPEITPLQSKLNVIAEYIAKLGGAAGLLLFLALFIEFLVRLKHNDKSPSEKGQQFINIFIVVVTIIVVAVPEGLPLAVTLALAFATTRMIRDNNLVRHLKACEVMGNATTICSDKTGTLTQNKMKVVSGTIGTSHRFGSGKPVDQETAASVDHSSTEHSEKDFAAALCEDVRSLLLKSISINSTAFEGEIDGVKSFVGSKTETSLLTFAQDHLGMGPIAEERSNATIRQLIPFDSGRKCMGVAVQLDSGIVRLYVKGASEILLAQCTEILADPGRDLSKEPLTAEGTQTIKGLIEDYAIRSLRTIGLVYRDFEAWPPRNAKRAEGEQSEVAFEDVFRNMTFIGMVGIQDPLREGVPDAVRLCQSAGVVVRMVTGDNKLTAQAIAKECGILQPDGLVMEGPEFRNLSKYHQNEIIPRLQVLARSSPEDKRILVRRLKDLGEIVAVTGDGTNDAPALKLADVGFSMGISGTEVAKEASAIILMDDNFTSIVKALKWGRAVNDAVKRFLQFQLTVNVTAVALTFVSAVSSTDESSVLTAVQLLWVNLIMDTLAALALATDPPQDSVLNRKPERRGSSIISPTMWKMIIGQSIYQLVVTFVLYYAAVPIGIAAQEPSSVQSSRKDTLVFNTFVWMQIFNQWNNRRLDNNFNIFEGLTQNWFFLGINLAVSGAQVLIIFVGSSPFNISQLNPPQTGAQWAVAIVLGLLSIPVGMALRLIPDEWVAKCIPKSLRGKNKLPGLTVSDEEKFNDLPDALTDVRDELAFLKKLKGGRLNNLKFAVQHPLMAGIIAAGVAAGWSPIERGEDRDFPQAPRPTPSPLAQRENSGLEQAHVLVEEPQEMEESGVTGRTDVPQLSVPRPPSKEPKSEVADDQQVAHVAVANPHGLSELEDRVNDLGDSWETDSIFEDIIEDLAAEEHFIRDEHACTPEESVHYRQQLRMIGPEDFCRRNIDSNLITAKKMLTAFGIRPPAFLDGQKDEAYYSLLTLAMTRELAKRAKNLEYNSIGDAVRLLMGARNIVVLTGAGISTSLGIPDFRSKQTGLYSKLEKLGLGISDPQEVFNINLFREDPTIFYSVAKDILPSTKKFSPTHAFIKLLQDKGKLLTNYSQNIDNIEANAGISPDKLVQCHGSFATASCQMCGYRVPGDAIFDDIRAGNIPRCERCIAALRARGPLKRKRSSNGYNNSSSSKGGRGGRGGRGGSSTGRGGRRPRRSGSDDDDDDYENDGGRGFFDEAAAGVMKPDITFFGEPLPDEFSQRLMGRDRHLVDLVLVIGTSLKVAPVSEVVPCLPPNVPQICISRTPVGHTNFDIDLLGDCDVVVAELCRRAGWDLRHEMVPPRQRARIALEQGWRSRHVFTVVDPDGDGGDGDKKHKNGNDEQKNNGKDSKADARKNGDAAVRTKRQA
ncbi:hypothetical protein GGR56DRAFT_673872 [Xylariaceae sp. FL0804]|nr:hypothetical protein GGR56DRAFT_673872 [Xylariaceae sp. FL0804]